MDNRKVIYWFRNDLRLHDQPVLKSLTESGYNIIPFYCFDDRFYSTLSLGFRRTGTHRLKFLFESLEDLDDQLRSLGSALIIRKGNTAEQLQKITEQTGAAKIFAAKEFATDEIETEKEIEGVNQLILELHESNGLFKESDLPFDIDELPDVFTQFRKKVEKKLKTITDRGEVSKMSPLPDDLENEAVLSYADFDMEEPETDRRAAMDFYGGESAALNRLHEYTWESEKVLTYKKTRNGLLGRGYSTKFSPWLANGSLSPLKVIAEINRFEEEKTSNSSTYWVKFELMWREYFRWIARKYGGQIFSRDGIKNEKVLHKQNVHLFEKWRLGNTGDDFVDANMKELWLSGFMSNRGRQNVASYLCKNMNIDWRWGASWFESQLIDYDVYSNWGNWMYVAGVGNDPRENRFFNTQKQAERYDADRKYRDLWLKK